MKRNLRALLACGVAVVGFAAWHPAQAQQRQFDLRAQPATASIPEFARQGGVQIVAPGDQLRGVRTASLKGAIDVRVALKRLLRGTGLQIVSDDGAVIALGSVKRTALVSEQLQNVATPRRVVMAMASTSGLSEGGAADVPAPVAAVDSRPSPAASDDSPTDIIVTAQRRAQNIQDVPVSVAAFSGAALDTARIENVFDLQQLDPSLSVSAQSGAVIPFIRGIGNIASQTPGNESSVPVYVDDAYYSRLFVPYLAFADNIERVEVLKGPQGTLFGRNATGGLIHIITRDPGQTQQINMRVGYGSQKTARGQIYFSTPVTETLAMDFSAVGQKMGDGFGKNLFNGRRTYYRDFFTLRSKLVWNPTENTKVRLSAIYVYDNSSIGAVGGGGLKGYIRGLPPGFTTAFAQPPGFYDINVNYDTERNHRGYAFTGRIDQSLGFADLTSISFYRHSKEPWTSEGDHTNVRWLEYNLNVKDNQFTQELQLKSTKDSAFDWIVGAYYMNAFAAYDPTDIMGQAIELGGSSIFTLIGKQRIISKAGFGQASIPLFSDRTHVTGGLRYTSDKVRGLGRSTFTPIGSNARLSAGPDYRNKASFDKVTYKISLDHDVSDDLMAYGSYSRGYKSGVFNLLPLDSPAVPPEVVDAYELGIKASLFDRRMHLNIAGFWNDIKALQTNVVKVLPGGVATVQLASADKARTRGIEFSGDAKLSDGLTTRFSGQYVDAKFLVFPNAPVVSPLTVAPFGLVGGVGDVSGFRLPQIPKWKFNIGLDYAFGSEIGEWSIGTNLSYRSGFPWEADNVARAPGLTLINANLAFEPNFAEGVSIRVWGKNITNEKYYSNVLSQTGPAGFLASPDEGRTWGVELGYKF